MATKRVPLSTKLTVAAALATGLLLPPADAASLTLEERVEAQRAIERVFYRQRVWPDSNPQPKPAFEAVVSEALLRDKVEDTLRKSEALEALWGRALGADDLQAELDRMAANTRQPEVLREMFEALGHDPTLLAECLARPLLVDRAIRDAYATDAAIHDQVRRQARAGAARITDLSSMRGAGGTYTERTIERADALRLGSRSSDALALSQVEWDRALRELGSLSVGIPGRLEETSTELVVRAVVARSADRLTLASVTWPKEPFDRWWSDESSRHRPSVRDLGSSYTEPAIAREAASFAAAFASDPPPSARYFHKAVWTGIEMIVWGGYNGLAALNDGGRYNPSTDSWTEIPSSGAPPARYHHFAVWTGKEMIVWGGTADNATALTSGGRYDPITGAWGAVAAGPGSPTGRWDGTAVWTGSRMVVWGGYDGTTLGTGSMYDPTTGSWQPVTQTGAPAGRSGHTAVWTGSRMIVYGGSVGGASTDTAASFDPTSNTWSAVPSFSPARHYHTAVWTGTSMIVWGGFDSNTSTWPAQGGSYDPGTNTWTPIATFRAPSAVSEHVAVWTGTRMIVFGGERDGTQINNWGLYDPAHDSWSTIWPVSFPAADWSTAVWTGREMVVFGGRGASAPVGDGVRYMLSSNSWRPTVGSAGACLDNTWRPMTDMRFAARAYHRGVWTGSEFLIFGGWDGISAITKGARYNPSFDTWQAIPTANEPAARYHHVAVWTGNELIVWGGTADNATGLATGGRYDPTTHRWTAMTTANAPAGRWDGTAVWTGSELIVWGGYNGSTINTGGRYDPANDSWLPTTTVGAPSGRSAHSAVWTGSEMIVFGGSVNGSSTDTGGRYNPLIDAWTSIPTFGSTRLYHRAVWTGTRMLVWGGYSTSGNTFPDQGGSYDPSNNTWQTMAVGPLGRDLHVAVWNPAGVRMLIWGGERFGTRLDETWEYDPAQNSWSQKASSTSVYPAATWSVGAWTGSELLVSGGLDSSGQVVGSAGRYDRAANTWRLAQTGSNAPSGRWSFSSVWTGAELIVWGGATDSGVTATGARYYPGIDHWGATSLSEAAPSPRSGHGAVWSGSRMIVWGGLTDLGYVSDGFTYDPMLDNWNTISSVSAPAGREGHTQLWTGTEMIVWGGAQTDLPSPVFFNSGGRYNPVANAWTQTSVGTNVPAPRFRHAGVWAGDRMIVWGGDVLGAGLPEGGVYDPPTNSWTPIGSLGAVPSARASMIYAWTGRELIVWGGVDAVQTLNDGSRYDPSTGSWTAMSGVGAPSPRGEAPAAWAPNLLFIWSGADLANEPFADGARYSPESDTWQPIASAGAPVPRDFTTATWTGKEALVYGGVNLTYPVTLGDGAAYCSMLTCFPPTWYRDLDGDGHGDPAAAASSCTPPAGYVAVGDDCNDALAAQFPGNPETCDGLDNDCNGAVDDAPVPTGHPSLTLAKVSGTTARLSWGAIAGATRYDVVRGSLNTLRSSDGDFSLATTTCRGDDIASTTLDDTNTPTGDGFWYLVRAESCGGNGSYDGGGSQSGARDLEIEASGVACP